MVAKLPSVSCAVITLVPEDWAETLKVAEKVPLSDDTVVVMVWWVPKEMEIVVLVAERAPFMVTSTPTGLLKGVMNVISELLQIYVSKLKHHLRRRIDC